MRPVFEGKTIDRCQFQGDTNVKIIKDFKTSIKTILHKDEFNEIQNQKRNINYNKINENFR